MPSAKESYYFSHFAPEVRTHLEAGAFRAVCLHLSDRSAEVQNIDLMIIGGFCRNCLAKWLVKEARTLSSDIGNDSPKEVTLLNAFGHSQAARDVYGCDFFRWKKKYPQKATFEQMQQYQESEAIHAVHKDDKQLKSGMTVAMTKEFESKFKMRLEAGAFKSLLQHLSDRSDTVQNIDLMTVSGFCRNCLAKWMVVEARKLASTIRGVCQDSFTEEEKLLIGDLDAFGYDEAAHYVYGCEYSEWKRAHAIKATNDQISMYKNSASLHAHHDKKLLEKQADAGPGHFNHVPENETENSGMVEEEGNDFSPSPAPGSDLFHTRTQSPPHVQSILKTKGQTSHSSSRQSKSKSSLLSDVCCEDVDSIKKTKNKARAAFLTYMAPPPPKSSLELKVGILTVSDRAARNEYENGDQSGPAVEASLAENIGKANSRRAETDDNKAMIKFCVKAVVPDEKVEIKDHLLQWCGQNGGPTCDLIFTTGGTGFSPRDVTPEATRDVIEREALGLMVFATSLCANIQPLAPLSRCIAGICGESLIVNLPGNPNGVGQMLDVLVPLLLHAVKDMKGL